jgi:pSer/pThr/pTyr-binding forkhead associated (FHA) protein
MVKNYLVQLGLLEKTPKGYVIEGVKGKAWPTYSAIQDDYRADPTFALTLQTMVNDSMTEMLVVEEPSGPVNSAPGEEYTVGGNG